MGFPCDESMFHSFTGCKKIGLNDYSRQDIILFVAVAALQEMGFYDLCPTALPDTVSCRYKDRKGIAFVVPSWVVDPSLVISEVNEKYAVSYLTGIMCALPFVEGGVDLFPIDLAVLVVLGINCEDDSMEAVVFTADAQCS